MYSMVTIVSNTILYIWKLLRVYLKSVHHRKNVYQSVHCDHFIVYKNIKLCCISETNIMLFFLYLKYHISVISQVLIKKICKSPNTESASYLLIIIIFPYCIDYFYIHIHTCIKIFITWLFTVRRLMIYDKENIGFSPKYFGRIFPTEWKDLHEILRFHKKIHGETLHL